MKVGVIVISSDAMEIVALTRQFCRRQAMSGCIPTLQNNKRSSAVDAQAADAPIAESPA